MSHIHALNVVHRDIKAPNILLTASKTCRLGDFGAAAFSEASDHHTVGSLTNCAPEALPSLGGRTAATAYKARPVDMRAVGVTVYELNVRKPPFRGTTLAEILRKIRLGAGDADFF